MQMGGFQAVSQTLRKQALILALPFTQALPNLLS
jgi:hypothetical protein